MFNRNRSPREKRYNTTIVIVLIIALIISVILAVAYVTDFHKPFLIQWLPQYQSTKQVAFRNRFYTSNYQNDPAEIKQIYQSYLAEYNKHYKTEKEFLRRLKNFERNLIKVEKHNREEYGKTAGYQLAINFMSDWDDRGEGHGWFYGSK